MATPLTVARTSSDDECGGVAAAALMRIKNQIKVTG
jgi:hypothetical protein